MQGQNTQCKKKTNETCKQKARAKTQCKPKQVEKASKKKSAETHRKKMQIRNAKEKNKCKITIQKMEIKHAENAYDPGTPPEIEEENIWEMANFETAQNVSVVFSLLKSREIKHVKTKNMFEATCSFHYT